MSERGDVLPVSGLVGRAVLSLSTGNKLGTVSDVFLDAVDGRITGFTLDSADGERRALSFEAVHSFGQDAVMAVSDDLLVAADDTTFSIGPNARELSGTKVITASGTVVGQIAGVYVTTSEDPFIFYEIRESMLDTLLGRHKFIPASAGHALSDDRGRLIVPDEAVQNAAPSIEDLLNGPIAVRSVTEARGPDDTIVIPEDYDDETVVHSVEDEETVVHIDDDADRTVLRWRKRS